MTEPFGNRKCKQRGCTEPVVGHSTTGKGYVCAGHNELEWGKALRKYDPTLSRNLIADGNARTKAAA